MKTTRIISAAISVSLSSMLIFGTQQIHDFAYYVALIMNILAWLMCWSAANKETAQTMVSGIWQSIPLSAFSIYALASTGHPKLAASSFMLSFVILVISFSVLNKKEDQQ